MTDTIKLAELLCARFSHDITGPVSAVRAGTEILLEEMPDLKSEAANLIESSATEAVARIQFYRQAYGYLPSDGNASLTETRQLAINLFATGKIRLDWEDRYTDMANIDFSYTQKKLVLNLLILASSVLMRGGLIRFEVVAGKITITATGPKAELSENYEKCLAGGKVELDPRNVQCAYTKDLLDTTASKLSLNKITEGVIFELSF